MRGTLDVFTFLALLGLFLMLVFAVLWGGIGETGKNVTNVTTTTTLVETTTTLPKGMLVGRYEAKTWRRVNLGFANVSHVSHELDFTSGRKKVFNGLLFGSEELAVHAKLKNESVLGAKISFKVVNTNSYGKLKIYLNGRLVEEGYFSVGEHELEVRIDELREENEVRFAVESSGWKLWAPAIYELEDAGLVVFYKSFAPAKFKFFVYTAEAESLTSDKGYITLEARRREGNLTIRLNGAEVFSGEVNRSYFQVLYDQSLLKSGENELELLPSENSVFVGDISLIFYYTVPRVEKATKSFEINESAFQLLSEANGTISFRVTSVVREGGLKVELLGPTGERRTLAYEALAPRSYSFDFNASFVGIGRNVIEISAVDDALFYVANLTLALPGK